MSTEPSAPARTIEDAILAVYDEVGYVQKESNRALGYSFASESALIHALRPQMIAAGITMRIAEVLDLTSETFTTTKGSVMNHAVLRARVRFAHAASQTFVDVESIGEGMDVGDKATNKALTGAYKYAIRQTFMIETGDDPDTPSSDTQERSYHAPAQYAGSAKANAAAVRVPPSSSPGSDTPWGALTRGMPASHVLRAQVMQVIGEFTPDNLNQYLEQNPETTIERILEEAATL